MKSRMALASAVRTYLRKSRPVPCLQPTPAAVRRAKLDLSRNTRNWDPDPESMTNRVVLANAKGKPLVTFKKQIGMGSYGGRIYMHTIPKAKIRFSSKTMRITDNNRREIDILKFLTSAVERGFSPNFPIMYHAMECRSTDRDMPKFLRTPYYVVFSELADESLEQWYAAAAKPRTFVEHASVMAQVHVAILALHMVGLVHEDAHLGNFLVHKTTPGGYWRYIVGGKDVFIKNVGYLVVIWDFGIATNSAKAENGLYGQYNYEYATKSNATKNFQTRVVWTPPTSIAKEQKAVLKKLEAMAITADAAVVVGSKPRTGKVLNARRPYLARPCPVFSK